MREFILEILYASEIHEQQVFQRFEDEEKEWIMVRPSYPSVRKIEADQKPLDVARGSWKVGDLVDWHKDDCYWSGTVVALKKNEPLQVDKKKIDVVKLFVLVI